MTATRERIQEVVREHHGTVLARLGTQVADYTTSKGALQFPLDRCLPADLVQVLVEARMEELAD